MGTIIYFDRTGREILHYSKVHTCAFDLENVLDGGEDFYTAELDFGRGTVKIGSMLFDGVPWQPDGVRDMCVFEAPGTPGVYVAELDLDRLRTHRSNDIMGDKYRHPDKYGILSDSSARGVIGGEFVHW